MTTMTTGYKLHEVAEELRGVANQLERWADEAQQHWSTQHVDPMRKRAQEIYALLGRLGL